MNEQELLDKLTDATTKLQDAEKHVSDARKLVKTANDNVLKAWHSYAQGRREQMKEAGTE